MAQLDFTRENLTMMKKSECFFADAVVEGTENGEVDMSGTGTTNDIHLANLPLDSIVTNAYIHVETAADAATSSTGTLGTAAGGSQIVSAANMKTTGKQGTFAGQLLTGTGLELWLRINHTGAATNVGKYWVVVEYLEPTKKTGELTKV